MTSEASAGKAIPAPEAFRNEAAAATDRPSLLALLGWLGFVGLLFYLVTLGGTYLGIQAVALRVVSLGLVSVVLAGWALLAWRRPRWRPRTAIWPSLVIPLASMALSTALSAHPRLGIEYLAWSVLLVALYLLLVRILATETARARIGGLAALFGGLIGLLYLGVVAGRWIEWWDLLGRLAIPPLRPGYAGLTVGGPNIVASVVLLLTVIALAGLGFRGRGRRIALALLVAIAAATVLVSGSRSAWLALAGALVLVGVLGAIVHRDVVVRRLDDRRAVVALGAGLGALAVGAIALGPVVIDRLVSSGDGGRPSYFASAIRMFEDAPIVGLGPGTWAARRIAYLEPAELEYAVPHAHDVYLQTLAELGLVGFFAGAVAFAAVGWLVLRAIRSADGSRRAWAWATLFILVYLAIANVADFYANLPGTLVLLAIPVAWLDASADRGIGVTRAIRERASVLARAALAALIVGAVISVGLLVWAESTALTNARAAASADAGDWDSALPDALEATRRDPSQPGHQLTLALAALHERDWDVARQAYLRSVAVDDLPQAWLGLALATLEAEGLGSAAKVVGYLERAMRMGRQHATVSYGVGEVYDRLGTTDAADEAYVEALVRLPSLAADPTWGQDPAAEARFERLLARAIERAGGSGWLLALMAGEPEWARSLVADAAAEAARDPDSLLLDIVAAWDGDTAALGRVQARALAEPMDAGLLATAGLLSARAGDQDAAHRLRLLAATTVEGPAIVGVEVHTASGCEGQTRLAAASDLHGQLAYRRPTPRNLMPVGLRCLVLHDPAAG